MKFSFSDNLVTSRSFLDLCNIAQDYGYDGIEIFDAKIEKQNHADSIFRSSVTADAKRKLVNRHIEIPVISYPQKINENTDAQSIVEYVDSASIAGVSGVVINICGGDFSIFVL